MYRFGQSPWCAANAVSRRDSRSGDAARSSHPRPPPRAAPRSKPSPARGTCCKRRRTPCAPARSPDERRRAISRDLQHQILAFPARHAQLLEPRSFDPCCFAGSCFTAAPPCFVVAAWEAAADGSAADELGRQQLAAAVQARSHRSDGAGQCIGGLRVAELLQITQHDDLAISDREAENRAFAPARSLRPSSGRQAGPSAEPGRADASSSSSSGWKGRSRSRRCRAQFRAMPQSQAVTLERPGSYRAASRMTTMNTSCVTSSAAPAVPVMCSANR